MSLCLSAVPGTMRSAMHCRKQGKEHGAVRTVEHGERREEIATEHKLRHPCIDDSVAPVRREARQLGRTLTILLTSRAELGLSARIVECREAQRKGVLNGYVRRRSSRQDASYEACL